MPHPKMKSEEYTNFGGINEKISKYLTSPLEFLDIRNYDYQTPGALSQRWGSSQYIGQTFAGKITSLYEFIKLDGSSYIFTSHSGGIWFGATTGAYQGVSFTVFSTLVSRYQPPDFGRTSGNTIIVSPSTVYYEGDPNFILAAGMSVILPGIIQNENRLDYETFNNHLFGCDGSKYFKFNGSTFSFVSLPPPLVRGDAASFLYFNATQNQANNNINILFVDRAFIFYASYVNSRGFEGPIWPIASFSSYVGIASASLRPISASGSFPLIGLNVPLAVPQQYDISSINIYCYSQAATTSIGASGAWNFPYRFLANYSLSQGSFGDSNLAFPPLRGPTTLSDGSTAYILYLGTTFGGQTGMQTNIGSLPDPLTNQYEPLGATFTALGNASDNIYKNVAFENVKGRYDIVPFCPSFIELFQNQLMLGGFSGSPSDLALSNVGEPEGYIPDRRFEVRTNDSDILTAGKTYLKKFMAFKKNSFHELSGDSVDNYILDEVSNEYGALNNRCVVVYQNNLMFLDKKGLIKYNGAQIELLSDQKIKPTFDSMNLDAAFTEACMVNDTSRNQVLIGVPVNGATINNVTIVYDYLQGAFTKYDGFSPSVFQRIRGYTAKEYAFFGTYSGVINWFGPSFLNDNGQGFTLLFKPAFLHPLGQSTQNQFRRLYINAEPTGATLAFNINFFQDYGTSVVLSTSLVCANAFQNRIDFGISAKSLTYEASTLNVSFPVKFYGFTIESRLQRRV